MTSQSIICHFGCCDFKSCNCKNKSLTLADGGYFVLSGRIQTQLHASPWHYPRANTITINFGNTSNLKQLQGCGFVVSICRVRKKGKTGVWWWRDKVQVLADLSRNITSCRAMSRHAQLCQVITGHVISCHNIMIMPRPVPLCHEMSYLARSRSSMSSDVMSWQDMTWRDTTRQVVPCHAKSCHVVTCHVIACHMKWWRDQSRRDMTSHHM